MNTHPDFNLLLARLVMVFSMYILVKSFSRWFALYALLLWPATVLHELSHLLVGILLRTKPVGVSLWPRRVPGSNRYVLGHVAFNNLRWWKKLPVAVAPLLLLFPLGCWLVIDSLAVNRLLWANLVYCFCAMQCFIGSWPSAEDWAQARTTIYALLALGLLVVVGYATKPFF